MITIEKLKEYEEYHGYYDGFYIQKVKSGKNITNDDEWFLIGNLIQDIKLVIKGVTSKEFKISLENKLRELNNEDVIIQLYELAKNNW